MLPTAFVLAFLTGIRHAFEPDHVVAVSTLVRGEPRLARALCTGLAWGAGHTTMLMTGVLVAGALVGGFRTAGPPAEALAYLELPAALLLLGLGAKALYAAAARRSERTGAPTTDADAYAGGPGSWLRASGWQSYAVGLVHGFAGSGVLLLAAAAALPSMPAGLVYALLFGTGSALGMGAVAVALVLPFLSARGRPSVYRVLTGLSGVVSIALGLGMLADVLA